MRLNDVIHCVYSMGPFHTLRAIKDFNITDNTLYETIDGELRSYCDDNGDEFQRCCEKLKKLVNLINEYK